MKCPYMELISPASGDLAADQVSRVIDHPNQRANRISALSIAVETQSCYRADSSRSRSDLVARRPAWPPLLLARLRRSLPSAAAPPSTHVSSFRPARSVEESRPPYDLI